jgi:hypothetical protein
MPTEFSNSHVWSKLEDFAWSYQKSSRIQRCKTYCDPIVYLTQLVSLIVLLPTKPLCTPDYCAISRDSINNAKVEFLLFLEANNESRAREKEKERERESESEKEREQKSCQNQSCRNTIELIRF